MSVRTHKLQGTDARATVPLSTQHHAHVIVVTLLCSLGHQFAMQQ